MVSLNSKLIGLLPPKCGSNSVSNVLKKSSIIFKTNHKSTQNIPPIHRLLSEEIQLFNIDDVSPYKVILFSRNPYQRFISAMKHHLSMNLPKDTPKQIDDVLYNLEKYFEYLLNDDDMFYKKFYGDISHKYNSYEKGHWGGIRLFYPQHYWVDVEVNTQTLYFIKMEDLKKDITLLEEIIGVELQTLPHLNRNNRQDIQLTKKHRKIIDKLYEKDYEVLNYG